MLICRACCCNCVWLGVGMRNQESREIVTCAGTEISFVVCSQCKASMASSIGSTRRKRNASDAGIESASPSVRHASSELPEFIEGTAWSRVLDAIARVCEQSLFRFLCADVRDIIGRFVGTTLHPPDYIDLAEMRSMSSLKLIKCLPDRLYPRAVAFGVVELLCKRIGFVSGAQNASITLLVRILERVPHAQLLITLAHREALITCIIDRARQVWPAVLVCPWRLLARLWTTEISDQLGKLRLIAPLIDVDVADMARQFHLSNDVFTFLAPLVARRDEVSSFVTTTFGALFQIAFANRLGPRRHPDGLLLCWYLSMNNSVHLSPEFSRDVYFAIIEGAKSKSDAYFPLCAVLFDAILRGEAALDRLISDAGFPTFFRELLLWLGHTEIGRHAVRALASVVWSNRYVATSLVVWEPFLEWHDSIPGIDAVTSRAHSVCMTAAFAHSLGTNMNSESSKKLLKQTMLFLSGNWSYPLAWPITEQHLQALVPLFGCLARLSKCDDACPEWLVDSSLVATVANHVGAVSPALSSLVAAEMLKNAESKTAEIAAKS